MAITKSARAKAPAPSPSSRLSNHHTKAPYGFVFLFILLTATFAFSTFFVVSQTAREQMLRETAREESSYVNDRVDALQAQVTILSAQVAAISEDLGPFNASSTTSTLPKTR